MKTWQGCVLLSNGKYTVEWPVNVKASNLPVAFHRAAEKTLRQWRKNGHRHAPAKMQITLVPVKTVEPCACSDEACKREPYPEQELAAQVARTRE